MSELIKVETLNAATVFASGGMAPVIETIRKRISDEVPDVETAGGRKRIASNAHEVARSKVALDNMGKALTDDLNRQLAPINQERKKARDALDELKAEIRKPLTEWEDAEEERVRALKERIRSIYSMADAVDLDGEERDASTLEKSLVLLKGIEIDDTFEEFIADAAKTKDSAVIMLEVSITKRKKWEADQAELDRLKKAAAEKAQQDRDAEIAREAAAKAAAEERDRQEAVR